MRILRRDWDSYDTAHAVFQPMTCEELDQGYAWCYDKFFSHRSIWRRRPADRSAVLARPSRDELSVQTFESLLALANPTSSHRSRVVTVERARTTSPYETSSASLSSRPDERRHRTIAVNSRGETLTTASGLIASTSADRCLLDMQVMACRSQ
jgi:hypothetical protein